MQVTEMKEIKIKTIKFIQNHGWGEAKDLLLVTLDEQWSCFEHELQQLLNSHSLVKSYGGLARARKEAHKDCFVYDAVLLKAIYDIHLVETYFQP